MSQEMIHIGHRKILVADYAVGASAVLGIRDSGKTVTTKGICEQLIEAKIQPIIFDAVGKWRFLKVPGPGTNGKGFKVVVAGGRDPDLPLNPSSVGEIVRAALRERIPLVIDLYDPKLSKADWRRIVQLAIRIIHYENEGGAVHVMLEEAAEFVPQQIQDGETYAEIEKLVRMGGNNSVGITLINQRSQEINKAVLDNCSTALVLGCQVGNKAIEAIGRWVERLDPKKAKEVTESLPGLKSGQAWVWTRSNLAEPSLEQIPMCRSLHPDRRTPEIVLKNAKALDPAEFVQRMAASIPKVIEDANNNDPKILRGKIAALEKKLLKPIQADAIEVVKVKIVEKPIGLTEAMQKSWDKKVQKIADVGNSLVALAEKMQNQLKQIEDKALVDASNFAKENSTKYQKEFTNPSRLVLPSIPPKPVTAKREGKLRPEILEAMRRVIGGETGKRRMVIALAQRPRGLNAKQLGCRSGLSSSTGSFSTYLSDLRKPTDEQLGELPPIINGERSLLRITEDGIEALGEYHPLPEGRDLLEHWKHDLGGKLAAILQALYDRHPATMTDEELGAQVDLSPTTGTFSTYLSKLRTLELVTGKRKDIRATDEFFT